MEDVIKGMPKSLIGSLSGLKGVYGIATDGEITTLTDSLKNFDVNMFANSLVAINIDGVEYIRTIISNTNNRFTFAPLAVKVQASVVIGEDLGGQVTATIVEPGTAGNDYSIVFTEDAYSAFTVATIEGNIITVVLETDAGTNATATLFKIDAGELLITAPFSGEIGNTYSLVANENETSADPTVASFAGGVLTIGLEIDNGTNATATWSKIDNGELSITAPISGVIGDTYSLVANENEIQMDPTVASFANDILTIGLQIDNGAPSQAVFGTGIEANGRIEVIAVGDYTTTESYTLVITQGVGLSLPTTAAFDAGVLTVTLGTDAASEPNATVADVVAAILLVNDFTASVLTAGLMETTAGVPFGDGRGPIVIATAADIAAAIGTDTDFTAIVATPGLLGPTIEPILFQGGVNPASIATATDVSDAILADTDFSTVVTAPGLLGPTIESIAFEGGVEPASIATATDVATTVNGIEGVTAVMTGMGGILGPITLTSFEGGYDGISVSVGDSYSLILK